MRCFIFALVLFGAAVTVTQAQDAIPNLKGTWSGKGKTIVFGNNRYHPGSQTTTSPPRVRDIESTHVVEGQDGRLVWGRSSSSAADIKEPFAWTIASDNKTIVGADMDGYFHITPHLARPHGEVLHPKCDKPKQIDRCHLSYDGSGEAVVVVAV
jgi:hypothetical protein